MKRRGYGRDLGLSLRMLSPGPFGLLSVGFAIVLLGSFVSSTRSCSNVR